MPAKVVAKPLTAEQQAIVEQNMGLVGRVAKSIYSKPWCRFSGIEFDELVSMGVHGLIRAVQLFNPAKSRLSTYANWWITQAIHKHLDEWPTIHVPSSTKRALRSWKPGKPYTEYMRKATATYTMYQLPKKDLHTKPPIMDRVEFAEVLQALNRLRKKDRVAIQMRFGIGCEQASYRHIANKLQVSRQRAHGVVREALERLRKVIGLANGQQAG